MMIYNILYRSRPPVYLHKERLRFAPRIFVVPCPLPFRTSVARQARGPVPSDTVEKKKPRVRKRRAEMGLG